MQILQHRFKGREVEAAGPVARHAEVAARDLAAKGGALEIKESRCAFQIGQGVGIGVDQTTEFGTGGQLEPQDVEELRIVPLEDAKQVGNLAAPIIDDLGARAHGAAQKDAAHADERLGIGLAGHRVEEGADAFGEVTFAAKPRCHRQ